MPSFLKSHSGKLCYNCETGGFKKLGSAPPPPPLRPEGFLKEARKKEPYKQQVFTTAGERELSSFLDWSEELANFQTPVGEETQVTHLQDHSPSLFHPPVPEKWPMHHWWVLIGSEMPEVTPKQKVF